MPLKTLDKYWQIRYTESMNIGLLFVKPCSSKIRRDIWEKRTGLLHCSWQSSACSPSHCFSPFTGSPSFRVKTAGLHQRQKNRILYGITRTAMHSVTVLSQAKSNPNEASIQRIFAVRTVRSKGSSTPTPFTLNRTENGRPLTTLLSPKRMRTASWGIKTLPVILPYASAKTFPVKLSPLNTWGKRSLLHWTACPLPTFQTDSPPQTFMRKFKTTQPIQRTWRINSAIPCFASPTACQALFDMFAPKPTTAQSSRTLLTEKQYLNL